MDPLSRGGEVVELTIDVPSVHLPASVALLTVYDMGKSVDKGMVIEHVRLLEKTGGKSGAWRAR